jgi:uncharacterized membrane protein YcaP (DUF421 family)
MFNTAFISLLGGTRFLYGIVKHKPVISHISQYQTPDVVVLITLVLAIGLAIIHNEVILAMITNFTVIIILLLLNMSYIRIQWKQKQARLEITTPTFIFKNSIFIITIIVFLFLFVKIIQMCFDGII